MKIILAAAFALAGPFIAGAQSNGVPGDEEYSKFSQFITDRNIFNPARYPRTQRGSGYTPRPPRPKRPTHSGAPAFTFVGTMSYEKGLFVFFDGSSSDYKKILAGGGSIAGYTVKEVSASAVKLVGKDKKEIVMKVGDQMRQEDNTWQLAGQGDSSSGGSSAPTADSSSTDSTTTTETPAAPSPTLQGNDILKRLMQQREQQLK